MLKKIFALVTACLLGLGILCGCGTPTGKLYTLEEAYENGFITREQLQEIADYHNDNVEFPEPLPDDIANAIKETAAYEVRNDEHSPIPEAKAEDYTILHYYGNYGQCYAIMKNEPYFYFPAVDVDYWKEIDGVRFHITSHYKIQIWKQK